MTQIENNDIDYAKVIRINMAAMNWNQQEFAAKSYLSRKYIGQCLSGKRKPSINVLENMANVFKIKLSEFIRQGE